MVPAADSLRSETHPVLYQVPQHAPTGGEIGDLRAASRCGAKSPCVTEGWASDVGGQRPPYWTAGFRPRGVELT